MSTSTTTRAPLLTIPEVARRLGLHRDTVYRKIQRGEIPAVRIGRDETGPLRVDERELLGLRWRDVSLVEKTVRVRESKSEEGERLIALSPTLADALAAHYQRTAFKGDDELVFCHSERGTSLDPTWYAGEFRAALKAVGITDYVRPFHDARHASLTNRAAAGEAPIALMTRAGHRSMSTTKGYLHLAGVVFRDEADALERRLLTSAY